MAVKKYGVYSAMLCLLAILVAAPAWADPMDDARAGLKAYRMGRLDQALQLFNQALAAGVFSRENLAIIHANRGDVWRSKGQRDRAIQDYTEAIKFNPAYAMAYNNRGGVLMQKGLVNRAIRDFDQAIRLDPRHAMAYANRGSAWQAKAQYGRAIEDYYKAIRLNPNYADAYYNRGTAWRFKGQEGRAIEDFYKAISLNRKHVYAYSALARILATSLERKYRDGKKAVDLARHAVQLRKSPHTLDTLAAAYAEAGMFKDAVRTQQQAITLLGSRRSPQERRRYLKCLEGYRAGRPLREAAGK